VEGSRSDRSEGSEGRQKDCELGTWRPQSDICPQAERNPSKGVIYRMINCRAADVAQKSGPAQRLD
jgi:hypothetical protein